MANSAQTGKGESSERRRQKCKYGSDSERPLVLHPAKKFGYAPEGKVHPPTGLTLQCV